MSLLDSADCLARVMQLTQVNSVAVFPTAAQWYSWMTEAQMTAKMDLAASVPNAMMGAPTLMTSADSGYTYTFGLDAATNPIFPLGSVQIFENKGFIPDSPMTPGQDYLMEGTQIRWVNNQARTFASGPWGRWVTPPYLVDANTAPTLPIMARQLIVYMTAALYASSGGQQDPTNYLALYRNHRDTAVIPALKKQFRDQGAQAALGRPRSLPYIRSG